MQDRERPQQIPTGRAPIKPVEEPTALGGSGADIVSKIGIAGTESETKAARNKTGTNEGVLSYPGAQPQDRRRGGGTPTGTGTSEPQEGHWKRHWKKYVSGIGAAIALTTTGVGIKTGTIPNPFDSSPNTASETLNSQVLGSPDRPTTAIAGSNMVAGTPEEFKNFISQPSHAANLSTKDLEAARKTALPVIKLKMALPAKDIAQGGQIKLIPNNYISVEPDKFPSIFPRDFIFPNNTDVVFAIEGVKEWKILLNQPAIIKGKEYPESFQMLADIGNNKTILLFVALYDPVDRLSYGDAIKNAPVLDLKERGDFFNTTKEPLIVPGDTTIFRTIKPNARIQIMAKIFEKGKIGADAGIYLDYLTNDNGQGLYPSSQS